jgi:hypothetical protein
MILPEGGAANATPTAGVPLLPTETNSVPVVKSSAVELALLADMSAWLKRIVPECVSVPVWVSVPECVSVPVCDSGPVKLLESRVWGPVVVTTSPLVAVVGRVEKVFTPPMAWSPAVDTTADPADWRLVKFLVPEIVCELAVSTIAPEAPWTFVVAFTWAFASSASRAETPW